MTDEPTFQPPGDAISAASTPQDMVATLNAESAGKTTRAYDRVAAINADQAKALTQQDEYERKARQGALSGGAQFGQHSQAIHASEDRTLRAQCLSTALNCTPGIQNTAEIIAKANAFYDFVTGKPTNATLHSLNPKEQP